MFCIDHKELDALYKPKQSQVNDRVANYMIPGYFSRFVYTVALRSDASILTVILAEIYSSQWEVVYTKLKILSQIPKKCIFSMII